MESIQCVKPVIILSKRVYADYRSCTDFLVEIKGRVIIDVRNGIVPAWFDSPYKYKSYQSFLAPWRYGVKSTETHYCYYRARGNWYPLYYAVPCGRCALCQAKKREDWQTRCLAESSVSQSLPVFLTLTYDEEHCPWVCRYRPVGRFLPLNYRCPVFSDFVDTFCVRTVLKTDLQKMFKRMRKAVNKLPDGKLWNDCNPLRYLAVSEYGSKRTRRPHFHIILWNFPPPKFWNAIDDAQYIYRVRKWIHEGYGDMPIWDKCEFARLDFDYCGVVTVRDDSGRPIKRIVKDKGSAKGSAKYVSKYVTKDTNVPLGARRNIRSASNRGGGIGTAVLKRNISTYRIIGNSAFLYFSDKKIGADYRCIMPQSFKRILFPSPSSIRAGKRTDILQQLWIKYERFRRFHRALTGGEGHFYRLDDIDDKLERLFSRLFYSSPLDYDFLSRYYYGTVMKLPNECKSQITLGFKTAFLLQSDEDNYNEMLRLRDELLYYYESVEDKVVQMIEQLPLLALTAQYHRYVAENYNEREYDVINLNKIQEDHDNLAKLNYQL